MKFILFATASLVICSNALAFRVGLVLDKGGKDDKSFNSAAYAGAMRAKKELGIDLKYVEATDLNALENFHRAMAHKNFDLIIGIGFAQKDAVRKVAGKNPGAKFAIVDGELSMPNVRSLLFQEHEGSFLVGAIAALKSTSGRIGFIGGMDIPLIRRFSMGYKAGAEYINPKIKISENYIGATGEAWNNPPRAKELALAQYNDGVDVIFQAAGASGAGVFDAAEEKKKFVIGVDSNQNWVKPGFVLTSMVKHVDNAVYDTIKDARDGKFTAGIVHYGLKDKGVDYALDSYNQALLDPALLARVEEIKTKIIDGKIDVPDYYKLKK